MQFFDCHSLAWLCVITCVSCQSLKWLSIIPGFLHLLNSMGPHHDLWCFTAIYLSGSVSFHVFQCHSVEWPFIVTGISLQLTGVALCSFWYTTSFHCNWGRVMRGLNIFLGVPLLFSELALCCFQVPTVTHWIGSALFQVFYSAY